MTLNRIIRNIHLFIGLQASMALLIFSITVLTFSTEENAEAIITQQQFFGDTEKKSLALAILLFDQVGNRFEAAPQRWMISDKEPDILLLKLKSPKGKRKIRLNKTNGNIEIKTWPSTFSHFINHMHQESFGRRRLTDSLWLWAWSLYIEISILALFALPITGLYIWVTGKSKKRILAKLSLLSSFIIMAILWNLIR